MRRSIVSIATILAACGAPSDADGGAPGSDAGRDAAAADDAGASDGGARRDAGGPPSDAGLDGGGSDAGGPQDGGPPDDGGSLDCAARCELRATSCGAPPATARAECARICAASPTPGQLLCLERLSCAAAACTYPDLPCGIGETDSVPLSSCETTCRATATRCGAPADVAAARCAALCPLVTRGEQLACLRDADCMVLGCIDAEGHHPCGIADGAPR